MALIEIETATLVSLLDAYICIRRANGKKKKRKKSLRFSRRYCVADIVGKKPLKKIVIVARQRSRVPLADRRTIDINQRK